MKRRRRFLLFFPLLLLLLLLSLLLLHRLAPGLFSRYDTDPLQSSVDFNRNGKDDYADFLAGARKDAENHPTYDPAYWDTGYPPEDIGVCTDVVWRAFREAGYSLRQMVSSDIRRRPDAYPNISIPDDRIDFRRVPNLHAFFREYALELSADISDTDQWQPGDIVIFGSDQHIGIVSDRRNADGQPYIIHNSGQLNREENYLPRANVTGHYRFDASRIEPEILAAWGEGL